MILRQTLKILALATLAGCSVGPTYKQPPAPTPIDWKNKVSNCDGKNAGEMVYLDYWWQVFEDPKLEELETIAVQNNRDIYAAYQRIQEARAIMCISAGNLAPQIFEQPQYTNTFELIKNYVNPQNTTIQNIPQSGQPFRAHELFYFWPLNLTWEIDLWGKLQDQVNSDKYRWQAQKKDYQNIMLSLTSNLAIAYYQLRTLDARIDLLKSVLVTRQKALEINSARYEGQIVFYADVTLSEEEVQDAIIQYDEALRQRNVLENQIAVLTGVPASEVCLEHNPLSGLPPCIPSGIPSEVLLRRPDIAEAELFVRSDNELIKKAYALFYPSLILTATGGFESPIFKDFIRWFSRYLMLGAQSNQLVFDGFITENNLYLQISRFKEASAQFQQQVLIAFQEVENALGDIESYADQYNSAVDTVQWAGKTYELYNDRYKMGVIYYINVVNTERDLLNFQILANSLQGNRFVATIQLIKALGGGWDAVASTSECER